MVGEDHHDSLVQRGIDEALACQDMLERAPVKPSLLTQGRVWMKAAVRWLSLHQPSVKRRVIPPVTNGTISR